ncbi:unnamed protein product, partial [Closterium sp. Naga37s-1]
VMHSVHADVVFVLPWIRVLSHDMRATSRGAEKGKRGEDVEKRGMKREGGTG